MCTAPRRGRRKAWFSRQVRLFAWIAQTLYSAYPVEIQYSKYQEVSGHVRYTAEVS